MKRTKMERKWQSVDRLSIDLLYTVWLAVSVSRQMSIVMRILPMLVGDLCHVAVETVVQMRVRGDHCEHQTVC